MAKKKKRIQPDGPYLAAAVFCDQVVRGDDGSMSVTRIIDHVTVTVPSTVPDDVQSAESSLVVPVDGLLVFKSGSSGRGTRTVLLNLRTPDGKTTELLSQDVTFSDNPHGGASVRLKLSFSVSQSELLWVDVYVDSALMTCMPLYIAVKREDKVTAEEVATSNKKGRRSAKRKS